MFLYIFSIINTWAPSWDIATLQVRYAEIMSDEAYLDDILAEGASKAASIADATLNNVYQAMGFLRRWAQSMVSGTWLNKERLDLHIMVR